MAVQNGDAPVIIRRIVKSEEGHHHGGAWKVAYADFVTAMMAFFLLMWLLNATTEQQRAGLADYFSPTIVRTLSGPGGAGATSGEMTGASADATADALEALQQHIQNELAGIGAESMQKANLLRHIVTRVTDEGLVIELSSLTDAPLFRGDTAEPEQALRQISAILAGVLSRSRNQIAIAGHVRSFPEVLAEAPVWPLSNDRAQTMRGLLEEARLRRERIARVTGHADRKARMDSPMAPENDRIEIILLR
ncbi:MAG: flagellar motor protein MotB [Paracoccus sp. (in: a-proteobacteria)]|nr:flagellar motor protein MotB [Paracoccus sp. (in: a-proteobacteria)]